MKIMIINGSPRKNGSTAYLLHEIEKGLMEQGCEIIFYDLCNQDISFCKGCCICYKTGNCIINDDAEKISRQLGEVDGLVIGSSTIASNVPGTLKVFIDRGHFVIEQLLHGKYAVCVSTYENYGGHETSKILKSLVTLSGATLSGTITEKVPFNSDYSANTKLNNKARKYAVKIYNDILHKKPRTIQSLKQKLVIAIGLKPFILRKKDAYTGVQKRWADLGLL